MFNENSNSKIYYKNKNKNNDEINKNNLSESNKYS